MVTTPLICCCGASFLRQQHQAMRMDTRQMKPREEPTAMPTTTGVSRHLPLQQTCEGEGEGGEWRVRVSVRVESGG